MIALSPNYKYEVIPDNFSLEDKINIFEDRVLGWQLNMAEECAKTSEHSGFAVLHIVLSYFEMISKYQDGYTQKYKSKDYFIKGIKAVFPDLVNRHSKQTLNIFLTKLYDDVRCGLYHAGITGRNIWLSGDFPNAIEYIEDDNVIHINPHKLAPALKQHFNSYIEKLRKPFYSDLRNNFTIRFGSIGKG